MSFLDEKKLDPVGKENDDINNDGKVDKTDKYLKNRREKIAKNLKEEDLEEGKLKNFVLGLGLSAAALAGISNMNNNDPVVKRLKAEYEQAEPAKQDSIKKLITKRLIFLDTGKFDDNTPMKEDKKTVELPADTTFTLDLKHLMKKHLNEGKSQEDVVKLTKALMKKLHSKGKVEVDGTKVIFKENANGEKYRVTISKNGTTTEQNIHNTKEAADAQAKKINGGFMDRPGVKFKAVVSKDVKENQDDTQLALPEPPARDYLGDDGKDYEGGMAKSQMLKMKKYAAALCDMIDDESQLEAWVQAKLTKASEYMSAVYHYLDYQQTKNLNEAFELNGRKVVDLETDGGYGIDPYISAAYYDDTGEELTPEEIEDLIDEYPADLNLGGMWWEKQR